MTLFGSITSISNHTLHHERVGCMESARDWLHASYNITLPNTPPYTTYTTYTTSHYHTPPYTTIHHLTPARTIIHHRVSPHTIIHYLRGDSGTRATCFSEDRCYNQVAIPQLPISHCPTLARPVLLGPGLPIPFLSAL
jgi:hypothetical protein